MDLKKEDGHGDSTVHFGSKKDKRLKKRSIKRTMRGRTKIHKEQGLLNKQRITLIKSGLEIKNRVNLFTKQLFI